MPAFNPGPSIQTTVNTQPPQSNHAKIETLSVALTPTAAAVNTTGEQTFTGLGTGLLPGDVMVGVSKPTAQAGLGIVGFRISTTLPDTFYITFSNNTAGAITPTAAEVYSLTFARPIPGSAAIATVV